MTALDTADALTWSLARQCRPGDVLVNGVGTPLAIAAGLLARELLVPDLTIILAGSVEPGTHDVAEGLIDPAAVARRSKGTMGQAEMLDAIQRGDVTLQFVAPAQIDGTGRINTSRVKTRRLPGPLALPDVAVPGRPPRRVPSRAFAPLPGPGGRLCDRRRRRRHPDRDRRGRDRARRARAARLAPARRGRRDRGRRLRLPARPRRRAARGPDP
jgi:hypothetical protein